MKKNEAEEAKQQMREETDRIVGQTGTQSEDVFENIPQEDGASAGTKSSDAPQGMQEEPDQVTQQVQSGSEGPLEEAIDNDPAFGLEKKIKDKVTGEG